MIRQDLTKREKEVLNLISEGLTNPQIAEKLFITNSTVKAHLNNIYSKMQIPNRSSCRTIAANNFIKSDNLDPISKDQIIIQLKSISESIQSIISELGR